MGEILREFILESDISEVFEEKSTRECIIIIESYEVKYSEYTTLKLRNEREYDWHEERPKDVLNLIGEQWETDDEEKSRKEKLRTLIS